MNASQAKRLIFAAALGMLGAACSEKPAPVVLNPEERARYVYEIIEPRAACEPLRLKLKGKFGSREEVDALYEEAKKTGCLRREV
ncbi:MAG TPA: hypothetical protein PK375_02805 [Rhodocyclaceae bacterium]|nr:hypothetical protein [Rhodocyclaceae bacterium]